MPGSSEWVWQVLNPILLLCGKITWTCVVFFPLKKDTIFLMVLVFSPWNCWVLFVVLFYPTSFMISVPAFCHFDRIPGEGGFVWLFVKRFHCSVTWLHGCGLLIQGWKMATEEFSSWQWEVQERALGHSGHDLLFPRSAFWSPSIPNIAMRILKSLLD